MKKKNLIIVLLSLLIFVFAWIGFNIYHNSVKSTISESLNMQITPISPNFDIKTVEKLKKRQSIIPIYQVGTSQITTIPQPSVSFSESSSESANQASQGGSLLQ